MSSWCHNYKKGVILKNLWKFCDVSKIVQQSNKITTLRAEIFAGRNFRVFRVFDPNSRKFMPGEISKQENAKFFLREIIDNFKNAKVFSRKKNLFFQANLRARPVVVKFNGTEKIAMTKLILSGKLKKISCIFLLYKQEKLENNIKKNLISAHSRKFFHAKLIFSSIRESFFRQMCSKSCETRKFMPKISRFFWHAKISARENFCP